MHPIQKAMVDMYGSQCGFCTPGIMVVISSLFANNSSQKYIEEHLDGNLCQCTGYRPIWEAAHSFVLIIKVPMVATMKMSRGVRAGRLAMNVQNVILVRWNVTCCIKQRQRKR